MAIYEDPIIEENYNVTKENPLLITGKLVTAFVVLVIVLYLLLLLFAPYLVKLIPDKNRQQLGNLSVNMMVVHSENLEKDIEKTKALQQIADKIIYANDIKIPIKMHYSATKDVNAFATFAGNIIINQGMIDIVDDENTLAMVISHEISHVINHDPINSLGRGVLVNIIFSLIFNSGDSISSKLLQYSELSYSRSAESSADSLGLTLLANTYGNANGAKELFLLFGKQFQEPNKWLSMSTDHPSSSERIKNIDYLINKNQYKIDADRLEIADVLKK